MLEFDYRLLLLGVLLAVPVAIFTVKKGMLKPSAAILAGVMMAVISSCGGVGALCVLLFSYLSLALLDKIFNYGIVKATNDVNKKTGTRDFVQVLVNGLPACVCVAAYFFTGEKLWLAAYVCGIAEAYADSLSSDIGVLSKRGPVDICRFKKIPAGMSGGVTLLGSSAGLAGSAVIALLGPICFGPEQRIVALCALCAFAGCVFDSVLGSLVQAKYRCQVCGKATEKIAHCGAATEHVGGLRFVDNCMVNLLSNAFSCALCALLLTFC